MDDGFPRFVTHMDDGFISTLTDVYRERLRDLVQRLILDVTSSWVNHLPKEVEYKRVVGHGLNAQELAKNPRLVSRPRFWDPVSEGIRRANPVLVTNYFKEKFY